MSESTKDKILYATEFFTGGSVLVLEILGTRVIGPFYGTTVFVWTSLIIVTLGALALGYFFGGWFADRYPRARLLYIFIFAAGLFTYLPMKIDQGVLSMTNTLGFKFGPLIAAFLLFFVPLFILGMISPFVIRLLTRNIEKSGRIAGRVFAIGTVGSIVGGFLAGFYLLDKFSITTSLNSTAAVLIIVAIIGSIAFTGSRRSARAVAVMVLLGIGGLFVPGYVYSDTYTLQIHHQEQSFYGDLKVMEIGNFTCLAVNGSFQSCFNNREQKPTFTYIAEVERLVQERQISSMLLLGLGSGNVLHNLPPEVTVDVVEIDEKLVGIAKEHFGLKDTYYDRLIIDDARHYFTTNTKKYDLILVDIALGSMLPAHIFSKESMELWSQAITEDGIVLINGEGKLGAEDIQLQTILKTASSVFPKVVLTVTEPDRFTSVLAHLSLQDGYNFKEGGRFVEVPIDYTGAQIMTDDFNSFDVLSIEKLKVFRDEMTNVAGNRLLFSK